MAVIMQHIGIRKSSAAGFLSRTLDKEEQLLILNYFQSLKKSGGGQIEEQKWVLGKNEENTALLIRFSDQECVGRVCARDHSLSVVFSTKPDSFTSMDQKLFVRPHSDSSEPSTDLSSGGDASWIVLSQCDGSVDGSKGADMSRDSLPPSQLQSSAAKSDSPSCQTQTAKIEVYEYPEDCTSSELWDHFDDDQSTGNCLTPPDQIWNADTQTFILEFALSDAEKILSKSKQYLDEDEDEDSRISVRRFTAPIYQVRVTSDQNLNTRQLKKHLKPFGDVERYEPVDESRRVFVVTFANAEDAEKLAVKKSVKLGTSGKVTVELYDGPASFEVFRSLTSPQHSNTSTTDDRSDSPMSTASSTLTLNMELSTLSTSENPRDSGISGEGRGISGGSGYFNPSIAPLKINSEQRVYKDLVYSPPLVEPSNIYIKSELKPEVKKEPCDVTDGADLKGSAFHTPSTSTKATHIQIDQLPEESAKEMFGMLDMHFSERLDSGYIATKFEHSYDELRKVFRFDLRPRDIKELLGSRQLLFEDEEETALNITPLLTGRTVTVTVIENPEKARFGKSVLHAYFGDGGRFSSTLTILRLQKSIADLELQTCSVANLVVSIGRHILDNKIVLQAEFPGPDGPTEYAPPPTENLVVAKTSISSRLLKKYLSSAAGKVVRELGESTYLVEYDKIENAKKILDEESVNVCGKQVIFTKYNPEMEDDEEDEEDEEEEEMDEEEDGGESEGSSGTPEPTYIEIKRHSGVGSKSMHTVLVTHLQRVLGIETPMTKYEHSYDDVHKVYRFDMSPSDISKLTSSKQVLTYKDKSRHELDMTTGSTGRTIVIRSTERDDKKRLSKTQLRTYFGPKSVYASRIELSDFEDFKALMEVDSCSLACFLVSLKRHKLKNGMHIEASFPDDSPESIPTEEMEVQESEAKAPGRLGATGSNQSLKTPIIASQSLKTIIVTNLLDVDEQTVYFWVKSLIDVWPKSIQLSADEEKAIVKVPGNTELDAVTLRDGALSPEFHIHGERLMVVEVKSTTKIQAICSGDVDKDTLEAYFSNPKYTGITDYSAFRNITAHKCSSDDRPVFILSYASPRDVTSVLHHKPHRHGRWRFDVAEYYDEIGLCNSDSLVLYPGPMDTAGDAVLPPSLYIKNVDAGDLSTLSMYMSNRKRTGGAAVASCDFIPGEGAVRLVYQDSKVAERVYKEYYEKTGIEFKKKQLEIELELPWLSEHHDKHRVRLAGLNDELDPEKLKFYLSAMSRNVATHIFFDQQQTRAVAVFQQPLDYGQLLHHFQIIPLNDCPGLKLTQEPMAKELIAIGKLSKEDIELPLEGALEREFKRDVEVWAEEFGTAADTWKITTEPEAVDYLLTQKHLLKKCQSLSVYSGYLGLQEQSGVHKKSQELSNFVSDALMLQFLTDIRLPGHQILAKHLERQGIKLSADGAINIKLTSDKKSNRAILKNWRMLKHAIEQFIDAKFALYLTGTLTQQVYDMVKQEALKLLDDQPVAKDFTGGTGGLRNAVNEIAIAGEKAAVDKIKPKLRAIIDKCQKQIQEEKTITQTAVPNVMSYQIRFLELIGFIDEVKQKYKLKDFHGSQQNQNVIIHGLPSAIDAVQNEMLQLLPKIADSKVQEKRKPLFFKIFATQFAEKSIKQKFLMENLKAVWVVENRSLSVYSNSRPDAQKAMDIIKDMIWEEQYPADHDFDDLEKQLLVSGTWKDEKTRMQAQYQPLEIVELGDRPGLSLVGLAHHKASVLEDIPNFFDVNVTRCKTFEGNCDRILYLTKFRKEIFKDFPKDYHVKLEIIEDGPSVKITGTKDNIANCERFFKREHDSICKDMVSIDNPAMIQYVKEDQEVLENIGLKTSSLVVPHREDVDKGEVQITRRVDSQGGFCDYSVALPSGVICKVQKGNITTLPCDGIVNAANGDLKHIGGLALAIVKAGGDEITRECSDYIRKYGKLMEGQVMSSTAGRLRCKRIIHAVGPRWQNGNSQEERTLFNCIDNCFDEADKLKMQSLAIPPISTGIFEYPLDKAVQIIVEVVATREAQGEALPKQIIFTDNKDDSLHHFQAELRVRYEKSKPKVKAPKHRAPIPASPAAPTTVVAGKYTITGKRVSILNRINVEIKKGDLATSQEDSLVNSVGRDLNLKSGKASSALLKVAGQQLQDACTNDVGSINVGEVKETDGFLLPSKKVFHCCCPQWDGPRSLKALNKIVMNCLTMAASHGHKSIAFPALGTGNLRYPEKDAAKCMMESVIEYTEKNPQSSITDVKIVIFHLDTQTLQGFEAELLRLGNSKPPKRNLRPVDKPAGTPETSDPGITVNPGRVTTGLALKGCVQVNNTTIRIVHGDITKHQADVLVNSTDRVLSIQGQVSKAMLAKAGPSVKNEVSRLATTPSDDGIWTSRAGKLKADFIFHIDAHFDRGSGNHKSTNWSKLISNCLTACDDKELRSIAFPAIGTGVIGLPAKDMAKIILESAVSYINDNPQTCLTTIDAVIFQESMVKDFVESMSTAVKVKDSWWNRLKVKVSQWVSGISYASLGGHTSYGDDGGSAEGAYGGGGVVFNPGELQGGVLKLDIYAKSSGDIQKCKKELESRLDKVMITYLWSTKPSYKEDRELIGQLSPPQILKLNKEAEKLHLKIEVDTKLLNIKIVGLNKEVHEMSDVVAVELKNIERALLEKKEEALVALARQWEYNDEDNQWAKFDPSINKKLEDAYKKNANALFRYQIEDGEVRIDLSKMEAKDDKGTFNIRRLDLSKPQTAALDLPATWAAPLDTYNEFPVVPGTAEYNDVETKFLSTLGAGGSNVIEIRRVQNPVLYQQYMLLKKDVAKRLGKKEHEVEMSPLWHGTDENTVSKITSGKFDRGLSGKNASVYGLGSYFARDASYSARNTYSQPNASGHKYIIYTRVVTGEWTLGNQDLKAAPYKPHSTVEQYDSVVNDVNNPQIFVVFHDTAAYPEYIIKFA